MKLFLYIFTINYIRVVGFIAYLCNTFDCFYLLSKRSHGLIISIIHFCDSNLNKNHISQQPLFQAYLFQMFQATLLKSNRVQA